jgi:hypothetical protein
MKVNIRELKWEVNDERVTVKEKLCRKEDSETEVWKYRRSV